MRADSCFLEIQRALSSWLWQIIGVWLTIIGVSIVASACLGGGGGGGGLGVLGTSISLYLGVSVFTVIVVVVIY